MRACSSGNVDWVYLRDRMGTRQVAAGIVWLIYICGVLILGHCIFVLRMLHDRGVLILEMVLEPYN